MLHRFLLHSKLYRLATFSWLAATQPKYSPGVKVGQDGRDTRWSLGDDVVVNRWREGLPFEDERVRRGRELGFSRMVNISRGYSVPIVFITYPLESPNHRPTNDAIRRTGERFDVPVIDTGQLLSSVDREDLPDEKLFVEAFGPHPSGLLYGFVVRSLVPVVMPLL